jgi:hypothetical protein
MISTGKAFSESFLFFVFKTTAIPSIGDLRLHHPESTEPLCTSKANSWLYQPWWDHLWWTEDQSDLHNTTGLLWRAGWCRAASFHICGRI